MCVANAFKIAVQKVSQIKSCSQHGNILMDSLHSFSVKECHTQFLSLMCMSFPKVVTRFCVSCVYVVYAACDQGGKSEIAAMNSVKEDLCTKHREETKVLTQQIVVGGMSGTISTRARQEAWQFPGGVSSGQGSGSVSAVCLINEGVTNCTCKGSLGVCYIQVIYNTCLCSQILLHLSMSKSDDTKYCRDTLTKSKLIDIEIFVHIHTAGPTGYLLLWAHISWIFWICTPLMLTQP